MKKLIIVTGMPRTATPIITGILKACGAFVGDAPEYTSRRAEMFENREIASQLVVPFMRGLNADPRCQRPLVDTERCKLVVDEVVDVWIKTVNKYLETDGIAVYSSSRNVLIEPVWRAAFPDATWLAARRGKDDIVRACLKSREMTGYNSHDEWSSWCDEYSARLDRLEDAVHVWPTEILAGRETGKSFVRYCGLEFNEDAVASYIEPIRWKTGQFARR